MKEIKFMDARGRFGIVSIILVLISLGYLIGPGIAKGVDFEGGSKLTVSFQNKISIGQLRDVIRDVEEGSTIVELPRDEGVPGSEFTIKIPRAEKNEEGEDTGLSIARVVALEAAFASLGNDEAEMKALLTQISEQELADRLNDVNLLKVTGTDSEKTSKHQALAAALKSNVEASTSLSDLGARAWPEDALRVVVGLQTNFPAINRTTADLLGEILRRDNPLNRDEGASYEDVADAVVKAREANTDYLPNLDAAASAAGEGLGDYFKKNYIVGSYNIIANESFSASIAAELLSDAWTAVIMALLGILLYVGMRFQWGYAVASVVALTHDVIISLGFFAILGGELSNPVVAAFLTIVGYSLNDTIVVFDRIRDNLNITKHPVLKNLMNKSINQTLSRTMVTSITTFFVVAVIYFFSGNETLRDFSLPLIIGIVVGTYSSIFVASPTLLMWHEKLKPITE
ncbi:MAG: protein translocase subunit SecF [Acidobacteriota bacterium]|nr:protein translocase subunit SecF [Acidobacteriota bacterium]